MFPFKEKPEFPYLLKQAAWINFFLALSLLGALVIMLDYFRWDWSRIYLMHGAVFLTSACMMGGAIRAWMGRPNAHLQMLFIAMSFYGNYIYQGMCLTEVAQSWARLKLIFFAVAPGALLMAFNLWAVLNVSTRNYFNSRRYA